MSDSRGNRVVLASILDRLMDDEPERKQEAALSESQILRALRVALRRDLECFFNSRQRALPRPEDLEQLEGSLIDYGVPDTTGANLSSSQRRQEFLRRLESSLRAHEPRFSKVKVTALASNDPADRSLSFRIDAVVRVGGESESATFDSRMEPVSRSVTVKL